MSAKVGNRDASLILMIVAPSVLCLASWWLCWRTDQRLFHYLLIPVCAVAFWLVGSIVVAGCLALTRIEGSVLTPFVVLCAVLGLATGAFWGEIQWGAPRLESINGAQLSFSGGRMHKLPIESPMQTVQAACERLRGERLTLRELDSLATRLVLDGYARAGNQRLKAFEEMARENRYGMWGGGSYESDLREYERLKTKLGIDEDAEK